MIEVHLYGRFRRLAPNAATLGDAIVSVPVDEGETIETVVRRLGIDPNELSHLFLNAEYSGIHRRVNSGDRLGIFPLEMGLLYRQYFPKIEWWLLLRQYPIPILRRDVFDLTSGSGSWGLSMIAVDVRLFGNLRSLHPVIKPGEALRLTLPDEATIAQLLTALSIPSETVKIVFVNGVVCESGLVLGHGDRIGVFPPIAGGSVGHG